MVEPLAVASQSKSDRPLTPGRWDALCRVLYELGLVLALVTLALIPIHQRLTEHLNVTETIDSQHVRVEFPVGTQLDTGMGLPIYRFNPSWQEPIGTAFLDSQKGNSATLRFDPTTFRWPMGRQGKVLSSSGQSVVVNMGSDLGLKTGDRLNVFRARQQVGQIQLTNVQSNLSLAQILTVREPSMASADFVGLTASEFIVATQISYFRAGVFSWIEWLVFTVAIVGYFGLIRRCNTFTVPSFIPTQLQKPLSCFAEAVLGWYLSEFLLRTGVHLFSVAQENILHQTPNEGSALDAVRPVQYLLFGVILWIVLTRLSNRPDSLHSRIWNRLKFSGGMFRHVAREKPEHLTMFIFQLVIVFAFGRTLGAFFQENCSQGIAAVWPLAPKVIGAGVSPVSLEGFERTVQSIIYAVSHAPESTQPEHLFLMFQTGVYNLCILGCLFGYGYSLLGYLWGKRIRNVDFTVVGWLTNAVCYGPLLGVVLWLMLPPTVGADPTVTNGPLHLLIMIVGFYLNVVYTLTIWNLGALFGVMTDKGVRTSGFYSVVRHPSYTLESLMFVVMYSRGLSTLTQWFAVSGFLVVYWLRSEREDQFMSESNPEFGSYKHKTSWKFLPGLY